MPIALKAAASGGETMQYEVTISAARDPKAFPVFAGAAGVDVVGPSASTLWLEGGYALPASVAGRLVDATLMRGVAVRTLENLVDDLERACRALVDEREAEYLRSRRFVH